jgi:acetate CoA/acetoacetate CoA-transferase beta subunit
MAVIEAVPEGLLLKEVADGLTAQQVQNATEARLIVREPIRTF